MMTQEGKHAVRTIRKLVNPEIVMKPRQDVSLEDMDVIELQMVLAKENWYYRQKK